MRRTLLFILSGGVASALISFSPVQAQPQQAENPSKGKYTIYQIHGHKVHVSRDVSKYGVDKVNDALEELQERLEVALGALPSGCAKRLASVRLWVETENSVKPPSGSSFRAYYFPLAPDLRLLHQKCGGIEITAHYLLGEAAGVHKRLNPNWLLHELTHAYHDRVLDHDEKKIKQAYESAMEGKLYAEVLMKRLAPNGLVVIDNGPAYAGTNYQEYFAELSVAYLARNWAYPFTAEDLRKHDPGGYALMQEVWGKKVRPK